MAREQMRKPSRAIKKMPPPRQNRTRLPQLRDLLLSIATPQFVRGAIGEVAL